MKRDALGSKIVFLTFLFLLVALTYLWAEEPVGFGIGADYASVRNFQDSSQSYLEIYYSFNRRELKFVSQEEGLVATVLMQLSILDKEGNE
ncbi:MAG: hypothetical protein JSV10_06130, partial [Candidatus Zixiibacteriota bacterium]